MIHVARDQSVFSLSAEAAPVVRIRPGDSLVLDTADCFSDQVQSAEDAPGAVDWEHINPATGPVFVEGAESGDVLSVLVEHIEVAHRGVMAVSGDFGVLRDRFQGMSFAIIPIEDRFARVAGASVPVRPMIGVIGATLYLPVFVPGALLAAGDLHAAMGDGEICGTGVEVAGSIQLRVDVRRDVELANPVVETSEVVATIASAETLDEAADRATRDMADLLTQRLGLSAADATMLMSAAGQLQVSQVVDPLKTARYAMSKEILAHFGRDLM